LERLTRKRETAGESPEAEAGKEITRFDSAGKFLPCASAAGARCLSGKLRGCRGDEENPDRNNLELFSAFSGGGKNDRKDCTSSCGRKGSTGRGDGKYVSGAAELACVLLFGHTLSELTGTDISPESK